MFFDLSSHFKRLKRRLCRIEKNTLIVYFCLFLALPVIVYMRYKRCVFVEYTEEQRNLIETYSRLNLSFGSFTNLVAGPDNAVYEFNRSSPFIFISSIDEYSGSSYLQKVLNTHWNIACGHETNFISRVLAMRKKSMSSKKERKRLEEGGIDSEVFDNAVATFIFEILTRQVQPADNLCNVDNYAVQDAYTLSYMFPQSRFVMVVRDGRAVAHSQMPLNHTTKFNSTLYEEHLLKWDDRTRDMLSGCLAVGRLYCLAVYYEHLFLHPIHALQRILSFLNIPFPRHYDARGFVFYDKMEEILVHGHNPKLQKQLTTWVQCAPKLAFEKGNATHLLSTLGYLQLGNPPDYQNLDQRAILSEMLY